MSELEETDTSFCIWRGVYPENPPAAPTDFSHIPFDAHTHTIRTYRILQKSV